jgi:hypothetical protein
MRGQLEGARRGDWMGGVAPYGYKVVERPGRPAGAKKWPKMLVPGEPEKIEVVRWMFNTYATKDVSLGWLTDELFRRGVLSPRGSRWWAPTTIRTLLRRREYVGDYDWGRDHHGGYHGLDRREMQPIRGRKGKRKRLGPDDFLIVEQTHEPLIDRETFATVQARLNENQKRTTPLKGRGNWLLVGLMTCGHCGCPMFGATNYKFSRPEKRYRRYVCGGYHQYGREFCHKHAIDESKLLDCLIRKLQEDFLSPANLETLRAEIRRQDQEADGRDQSEVARLKAQIADLEAKIRQGGERMALVELDLLAGVAEAVRGWKDQRDKLVARLEALQNSAPAVDWEEQVRLAETTLWRLREKLRNADPSEVRAALRELVVKVELWWECQPRKERQKCVFSRGLIHVRNDLRINRLERAARAAL